MRSAEDGRNVAVDPFTETVPATEVPPFFSVRVAVVTEEARIASLNVTVTEAPVATDVAPLTGEVEPICGGVVSEAAGLLAGSPGKVRAVISARFVKPSPSESRFAMAVNECPFDAKDAP
ncbi:MAG: hypothetical protein OHK0028_20150 [Deltaproteobacteria bacterium]